MNELSQIEKENLNGIISIEKKLINDECVNITKEKKWIRKCLQCKNEILYKDYIAFLLAIKKNTRCKKCYTKENNIGRKPTLQTRQKMSISQKGRKHTEKTKQKMSGSNNGMYNVHRYDKLNPFYGKRHTDEAKRKMRISACKRILNLQRNTKDGRINNINLKEGEYFDNIEKENGWNGVYYKKSNKQFLIEDLGYFVDYYEPKLNLIVEYDEPRHYVYGELKEKDIKRKRY